MTGRHLANLSRRLGLSKILGQTGERGWDPPAPPCRRCPNFLKFWTRLRRLLDFGPLIFWMGLIFWLSSQSVLVEIDNQVGEKLFFKSAHIMAYAVLAWLWWRTLAWNRSAAWPVLGWVFLLTVLYGVSDEIHQLFVPGRHGRGGDVLFDAGGALLMVLLIRGVRQVRAFPEDFLFSS